MAPTTFQPVIRANRNSGEPELVLMRWGMVPHFARSSADFKGISTVNAKAETLMNTAMWRVPLQRRRCIVGAAEQVFKTVRQYYEASGISNSNRTR
jgi:putative SOS response-associated peptidase YedK